jgi:hypothetical protein
MRVLDAARNLARRYPGGIEALAPRIPRNDDSGRAKSPDVLRHELKGTGTNKFGLEDADLLTQFSIELGVSDPLAIINAMAANAGAMVLPLPNLDAGDEVTIQGLAQFAKEFSDVMNVMAEAVKDNNVSENELAAVDKELGELIGRAQALRAHLAQMHETAKPSGGLRAAA